MNDHEQSLTDCDRLKRIGEILCAAILSHSPPLEVSADEFESGESPVIDRWEMEPEKRVLDYLSRTGEASPAILRTVLHLPRTSAYRIMNRLVESGQIVSEGQTRSLIYRLVSLPPHNQNVEGN